MKRIAAVLAAAIALVAGPACSDDEVEARLIVQAAGGESEIKAIEDLAAAFEKERGGVRVDVVGVAEQSEHMARLSTAFAGGSPPDVFLLNYRRVGQFAAKGVIDPPREFDHAAYYAEPVNAFTIDGNLVCRPQNASSTVTYFNPSLFQRAGVPVPKAGWTYADMRSAAERLHAAGIEAIGFEHSVRTVAPFVWASDGRVVNNTARPTHITLDTPSGRGALTFLRDLLVFGVDVGEAAADPPEERFARGELAMLLDSRRAVPKLRRSEGLSFDVAPLPVDKKPATLLASDAYCVAKAGKRKPLAHAFAEYAVGPEGGGILAASGRTVPSLKALADSPAFLAPDQQPPSSRVWLDVLPTAMLLPNVAAWHETEEAASDVIEQFLAGRIALEEAVRRMAQESSLLLARDR